MLMILLPKKKEYEILYPVILENIFDKKGNRGLLENGLGTFTISLKISLNDKYETASAKNIEFIKKYFCSRV